MLFLQRTIGNQAVQRLMSVQRHPEQEERLKAVEQGISNLRKGSTRPSGGDEFRPAYDPSETALARYQRESGESGEAPGALTRTLLPGRGATGFFRAAIDSAAPGWRGSSTT
jgi:hypothetical protein